MDTAMDTQRVAPDLALLPLLAATAAAAAIEAALRPADGSDLPAIERFVGALSLHSRTQRFFVPLRELPAAMTTALRRADPAHRFVIAERDREVIALGQYAVDTPRASCELALVVADAWQGRGLGLAVVARLLDDAARAGLREAVIDTLAGNRPMRTLARRAGFELRPDPEDPQRVIGRRPL
jgi:acetyltransferase